MARKNVLDIPVNELSEDDIIYDWNELSPTPPPKRISFFDETLRDGLIWTAGKEFRGRIHEIAAFQVGALTDGLEVTPVNDRIVEVRFRQWGNWFLRKGLGASDYREDGYEVDFFEGGYRITFDEADPRRLLIYSDGGQWVEVPAGSK